MRMRIKKTQIKQLSTGGADHYSTHKSKNGAEFKLQAAKK